MAPRLTVLRALIAVPLACVVLIGALWLGQSLRAYREPPASPTPSDEPSGQAAASPAARLRQQELQFIDLPPNVDFYPGANMPSPDGSFLVAQTADLKLAIVRLIPNRDELHLRTELIATAPEMSFVAWMPDGRSFIAQSTRLANPTSAAKMKTADVFRIDVTGTRTKLGEAFLGTFALSPDGKLIAAFDGEMRLITIATDASGMHVVPNALPGVASMLGWGADGAIWWFDEAEGSIHRVLASGARLSDVSAGGVRYVGGIPRWSPDHRSVLVTATVATGTGICECERLITNSLVGLPKDAIPAWIGPHLLLTRASDERAGTVDALSGATTTLGAKMRSDKIRVLAVSLPYVMWFDETKNIPHILDIAKDRDTGVGLNAPPAGAYPLSGGRFLWWRDQSLSILDMNAWFANYVDAHPTPSPIPQSKDQDRVPAGFVRVERPEGGWSLVMPKTWYRRDAPMHGSEFLSYDPEGMDFSGNLPPAGEVRVILRMSSDYGVVDLADYAKTSGGFTMGGVTPTNASYTRIAGLATYTFTSKSNGGPPPWDAESRYWLLRSPFFSDRVVVIQSFPIARTPEVEALVQSLRFFKPADPPPPTMTRAQVIAQYSQPSYSATRVDRVEAKLVRWRDFESAYGGFRSGVNDPDELTWVVIVYGEIRPQGGRGGPARSSTPDPSATPQTFKYEVHAFNAASRDAGGMYGCCGPDDRPAWFDSLTDLAK